MSNGDYISKSELIEELVKSENQPTRNRDDFIEGYCEGWNDVVDIMKKQPTIDEKEIIRKAFERVVERLEEQKQQYKRRRTENAEKNIHHMAEINYAKACSYDYAIKIVKKECGISE